VDEFLFMAVVFQSLDRKYRENKKIIIIPQNLLE